MDICIICSSPGDYDIYAPIPSYLHASTNEFLLWPKHISKMLEETTGLSFTSADTQLPRKMCALCISYLKHASTFRQQAIDNILNLKAAQILQNSEKHLENSNGSVIISQNQLDFSQNRCSDIKNILTSKPKISKSDDYFKNSLNEKLSSSSLNNEVNQQISSTALNDGNIHNNHLTNYLNLLFDKTTNKTANNKQTHCKRYRKKFGMKEANENEINPFELELDDIMTASSDENDYIDLKKANFFNYKEKNFEEDDILNDILKDANIIINIPEIYKERKCPACCKRFMFEDSYDDHTSKCIEYQLLTLIEEVNRLLIIRRNKNISPHEFVRRMIFSLKKISDWLRNHGENIYIPSQSDIKKSNKKSMKKKDEEIQLVEQFHSLKSKIIENPKYQPILNNSSSNTLKTSILESKNQQCNKKIVLSSQNTFQTIQQNADKIRQQEPNDSSVLSNAMSLICSPSPPNSSGSQPSYYNSEPVKTSSSGNINTVLLTPIGHLTSPANYLATPSPKVVNFSARCSFCSLVFDTIGALESHNAKFHNYQPVEKEEHKKIIAMFEDE